MQQLGSGRFEYLQIRGGELILTPWPVTVRYIQFATPKRAGVPTAATSELRPQVTELFTYVRETDAGEIRELEVRDGLPFSMQVELAATRLRGGGV
jgi:hypothetical protein